MTAWANPNVPSLADFLLFVADAMLIPITALPANSPWPGYAFTQAMNRVWVVPTIAGTDYTLAVYNCAAHILLRMAPDQIGQTWFKDAREDFNMLGATSGVLGASSDQGTSNTLEVPEGLKNLTVADLDFFKTPYGREYMGYAQDFGPIAGLS